MNIPSGVKAITAAVIGFLVHIINFQTSAPWHDEVATLSAINRSWSELFQMFQNIDVVHAFYYAVMKVFSFGAYDINLLRLFSQIAFAVTIAFIYLIAEKIAGQVAAWSAVVAFTFLPATTYYSNEARSYSLTAMLGVIAVWLFLKYLEKFEFKFLVLSQMVLTLAVFTHFYAGVIAAILTVYLFALHRLSRSEKLVMAIPVVMTFGIFLLALNQKFQVFWLVPSRVADFFDLFKLVTSSSYLPLESTFWPIVIWLSFVYLIVKVIRLRNPKRPEVKHQTILMLSLATVPTILFIAVSLVEPVWTPRYSYFTLPFIAIFMGIAIANQFKAKIVLTVFALASFTVWLNSHWWYYSPDTKDLYPAIIQIVEYQNPKPDALWLVHNPDTDRTPQTLVEWRPDLFTGMEVVAPDESKTDSDLLFDKSRLIDYETNLDGIDSISEIAWTCPETSVDQQEFELQMRGFVSVSKTEWEGRCWRVQTWQLLTP